MKLVFLLDPKLWKYIFEHRVMIFKLKFYLFLYLKVDE
jgi:hypothetical protein